MILRGQFGQLAVGLQAAGRVEIVRGHLAVLGIAPAGQVARRGRRVANLAAAEAELAGQRVQVNRIIGREAAVQRPAPELHPLGR